MGESANQSRKIIALAVAGARNIEPAAAHVLSAAKLAERVYDTRTRALHDLRISVTDRCNFRCTYCMPKDVFGPGYKFLPHDALLSFEEITRFARISAQLGVEKIRLTGGEPTLRRDLPRLIEMLAALKTPTGHALDLTLTTNGSTLVKQARALKDAGLQRITVSLDSLDDATFKSMNDVDFPVADVLKGIDAAQAVGLAPIKVNMVVKKGVNDQSIVDMANHFKGTGVVVRYIEFMDVGATNGWRMDDVVPSADVVRAISAWSPLEAIDAQYEGEVAERWRYKAGGGEIGVISSVTQAFCNTCTRARLSTDGKIFTCLFATDGADFRQMMRNGASDDDIAALLVGLWQSRTDRYSEIRTAATTLERQAKKVEMSYIGG
ncbi:MAG: GTP 3',8-cyclase MoaA [Betaproteobacteria bacterium]|nr:MAG: GTP 3',8-cyclase MoaA [Betaproteobacteria bacterium]